MFGGADQRQDQRQAARLCHSPPLKSPAQQPARWATISAPVKSSRAWQLQDIFSRLLHPTKKLASEPEQATGHPGFLCTADALKSQAGRSCHNLPRPDESGRRKSEDVFGFLLYNICAACRGSSFVPIAHRPSFIVHLSRSEAVTLSYSFVLELHSNQVLQSSATIKCYNDLPRQRKRKTRDLKMPVQGVHQKLESIGTTGATIEQLQPRDTVLIADIRIYAAIAVGKAIENVYKRHLQQSPALQDVLVSNAFFSFQYFSDQHHLL